LVGRIIAAKKWDEVYGTVIVYKNITELYNMTDKSGDNLLQYSITKNPDLAEVIITSNVCDYNYQNSKKYTALMLACHDKREKLAMLLLDTGKCDLTLSRTTARLTALSYAKKAKGMEEVAAKLEALTGGPKKPKKVAPTTPSIKK
jgi:hypothetical protein